MASLLSPRRTDPEIALHATVAAEEHPGPTGDDADLPRVSWLLAAVGGALAAALCGWILIAGLTVLGWLASTSGSFVGATGVGTQLWLLANGAGAQLGPTAVTLVPWGATLLIALIVSRCAAFAARQIPGGAAAPRRTRLLSALGISAVMVVSYALPVGAASLFLNAQSRPWRALVAVTIIVGLSAARGSCRALDYRPHQSWPLWCRSIPRAVLGAQFALLAAGAAALTASLLVHFDRVVALTASLHAGVAGGLVLSLAQLAFVPNAVVWSASYALGAGFSLGPGTVVAPASTQHGVLPSVPLFGALPSAGTGDLTQLWWLAAGVVAGGVAAWLATRGRPGARLDETSLVGGLSGLLSGVVFVALAWSSSGNLGELRLADLGPRLLPLLMLAATTLGLAGMLVGLAIGLVRWLRGRHRPTAEAVDGAEDSADTAEEETTPLLLRQRPAPRGSRGSSRLDLD